MRFDMENLPIELVPAMAGVELGQQRQLRQFGVMQQRRRWTELREGLGCGFEEKFFVMRETMRGDVRAGREHVRHTRLSSRTSEAQIRDP
jgi:hypothetical protein